MTDQTTPLQRFLIDPDTYQEATSSIKHVERFDSHLYFAKHSVYKQLKGNASLPVKERLLLDLALLCATWCEGDHSWQVRVIMQHEDRDPAFALIPREEVSHYKEKSGWQVCDYLLHMPRFADSAGLMRQLSKKETTLPAAAGTFLAQQHHRAKKPERNTPYGSAQHLHEIAEAVGYQAKKYNAYGITQPVLDTIFLPWKNFVTEDRLGQRRKAGRVVRLHGRFYAEHLFSDKSGLTALNPLEWGAPFAYGDVCYDLASMVNHLLAEAEPTAADLLIESYLQASGDDMLQTLLPIFQVVQALQQVVLSGEQIAALSSGEDNLQMLSGAAVKIEDLEKRLRSFCDLAVQAARNISK